MDNSSSSSRTTSSSSSSTYYDVLGVARDADDKTIRQAYLRLSLQHHPDKNPVEKQEEAKARFVEIGQAYEVLKDPVQRQKYDRELRRSSSTRTGGRRPAAAAAGGTTTTQEQYDSYAEAFDAHVAGMSEDELRAAMGVAAVVGSVIGSFVGAKLLGKNTNNKSGIGSSSSVLGTAASVVGSVAASQAASSMVHSLHQSSVERVTYRRECQAAVERGEEMPPPLERQNWQDVVGKTVNSIMKETMAAGSSNNKDQTSDDGTRTSSTTEHASRGDGWKRTVGSVFDAASKIKAQMDQQAAASATRRQSQQTSHHQL